MALVTIEGNVWDHNRAPVPSGAEPELWFRPREAIGTSGGLFTGREVKADLLQSGQFTVQLESYPGLFYTPVVRWLSDAEQTDMERKSLGYDEWPDFLPDIGGWIGDLYEIIRGIGLVYVSPTVNRTMSPIPRYQLALNPVTWDVYEREITW